jgi:ubiquinone/menaquinone biosynthesis C-methylase UbiE
VPSLTADTKQFYDEDYFHGRIYADYSAERDYRLRLFEQKLSLVRKYAPERGRLLDVGCAAGYFLEVAKERGYEVYGVEISDYIAERIDKSLKSRVFVGQLEEAGFQENSFDVVTMWDVLEHMPNPLQTLRETSRVLKPGGMMFVETINTACLNSRLLGDRWPLYRPPFHLFYFSIRTLTELIDKSGLEVVAVEPIQTYSPIHRHKPIRYFGFLQHLPRSSIIVRLVRRLAADVVFAVATKKV